MRAVIMAGGNGARLAGVTTLPKPLAPIGGELPIVEIVLRQLARAGFRRATVALGHRADLIRERLAGARPGLEVDFAVEDRPLGSAGPLAIIDDLPDDFLVMNGDLLTDLDPAALLAAHLAAGNDITVSVCRLRTPLGFGVVRYDAERRLLGMVETPAVEHEVNMGVYGMSRRVVGRLRPGEPTGFDALLAEGLARGDRIGVAPFAGEWHDIGTPESYARANARWPELRARIFR